MERTVDLTREAESSRGHVATPRCPARSAPRGARSSGGGAGHARGPRTLKGGEPGAGHHIADAGLPRDDIYCIIDHVSQQLSSPAEPSVTISHDTHDTHSVAVLNLG